MIYSRHFRPIDWEIHQLERMEVRLQEKTSDVVFEPYDLKRQRGEALGQVTNMLYRLKAGRAGEEAVGQVLGEIRLPPSTHVIRNATLTIRPGFKIEIDTLILSQHEIVVLEIKNVAGTLYFNEEEGKTIRVRPDGQVDRYDCYVHQLDRQLNGLRQYLDNLSIPLPVTGAIVLANQNSIVEARPRNTQLLYRKQVPRFYRNLPRGEKLLSEIATGYLADQLSRRKSFTSSVLQKGFSPGLFRNGVLCLQCHLEIRPYRHIGWYCKRCSLPGREAVRQAVDDYFIMISETMTNSECRNFLKVKSSAAASRILSLLDLNRTGNPPATVYKRKGSGPLGWKNRE